MIPQLIHFRFIRPSYGIFKYRIPRGVRSKHIVTLEEYKHMTFREMNMINWYLHVSDDRSIEEGVKRCKEEVDSFLETEHLHQGMLWRETLDSETAFAIYQKEHGHFF